jgi:adenosylcobinamide hydrolase
MQPELRTHRVAGLDAPVLVWRFPRPLLAIASGPLGGGIGTRLWALNATVPMSYDRDDPDDHLAAIAAGLGLPEAPGVGLLTGVDVGRSVATADAGVAVTATVGLGAPAWAAAPDGDLRRAAAPDGDLRRAAAPDGAGPLDGAGRPAPGTINVVAHVPVRLSEAALVNAVATVAEAKAQALWELSVPGTGTCTDATCLTCPADGPAEPYGGPRSTWGARLARAVHAAVLAGGKEWQATPKSWSATVE